MNFYGDRLPFFVVYDLSTSGVFEQVASLRYVIAGSGISVVRTLTNFQDDKNNLYMIKLPVYLSPPYTRIPNTSNT